MLLPRADDAERRAQIKVRAYLPWVESSGAEGRGEDFGHLAKGPIEGQRLHCPGRSKTAGAASLTRE